MKTRIIALVIIALGTFGASGAEGQALRDVFKRVNASVVVIRSVQSEVIAGSQSQPVMAAGLGSGVLISKDGEIMTAAHLVDTADTVSVEFSNGDIRVAKVIASEPAADVALLKLNGPLPSGAAVAKLGDSDKAEVGDQIFVVGAPHGISYTLTVGYISGRRRPNTLYSGLSLTEFFQTDAAINQGNSGGPMFNMVGEIIGIVSAIISKSGGSGGSGFAVIRRSACYFGSFWNKITSFWGGVAGYFLMGKIRQDSECSPARGGNAHPECSERLPGCAGLGYKAGPTRETHRR